MPESFLTPSRDGHAHSDRVSGGDSRSRERHAHKRRVSGGDSRSADSGPFTRENLGTPKPDDSVTGRALQPFR